MTIPSLHRINPWIIVLAGVCAALFSDSSYAAPKSCSRFQKSISAESKTASANFIANMMNSSGSIKFESREIMRRTLQDSISGVRPADLCPKNCTLFSQPDIEYRVTPVQSLVKYSDAEMCAALLKQTTKQPLTWKEAMVGNIDQVSEYFMKVTQGSKRVGKELYEKCPGDCSPSYKAVLTPRGTGELFDLDLYVVCGHARDKSKNDYLLQTSLVWKCL